MSCINHKISSKKKTGATVLFVLIAWLLFGIFVASELEFKPAKIVLKSDSCSLVQYAGIHTETIPNKNGECIATLHVRPHSFSSGIQVLSDETTFELSEHQIAGYFYIKDRPYTPYQMWLIYWFAGATALLLLLSLSKKLIACEKE